MSNATSRRNFLRYSTLAGLGLTCNPFSSYMHSEKDTLPLICNDDLKAGQQRVTLLQSTDVHCQLHPHDEMFWETVKWFSGKQAGMHTLLHFLKK
jgi:S-sulfosulfanyl-L-cysteine sulfohydrolase